MPRILIVEDNETSRSGFARVWSRVVDEAIEAFGPLAETRSARVQANVASGLRVLADPRALHQIILNFLDNALKYGPAGQTVRVTATATGTHVRLCVEDEGPGVPAAERSKVWQQFYRLVSGPTDAQTPEVGGTGIRLAVVSELVAPYGGRVAIEDAPAGAHASWPSCRQPADATVSSRASARYCATLAPAI